ncbi:MAG: alpha-hydroxy acid oxidase [Alphaproteobacteria bacterium]
MRLSQTLNIADLRAIARNRLPRVVFDYIDGAVEDEEGMARNLAALSRVRLVPRYLVDVAERSQATALFGQTYAHPFGIAPTGLANLSWPGADTALARAAAEANIPFVLSTAATTSIEQAAEAAPDHFWFQLYAPIDLEVRADILRRAEAAGAKALMVTVDVPLPSKRERDLRNNFILPLRPNVTMGLDAMTHPGWALQMLRHGVPRLEVLAPYAAKNAGAQSLAAYVASQITQSLTWEDVAALRKSWRGPLVIKGILSSDDAKKAARLGVDAILISNHGGRQLNAAPAPIEMLPDIREAVGDKLVLMLDSGVRRGADIAKALALGADFVFVGRATLYGVAAAGEAGARRALSFLSDELDRCLAQIGCPDVKDLRGVETRLDGAGV